MPVSVKIYYGCPTSAVEIRRFIFRPEQHRSGIYHALLERIRALFNGLNLRDVHLCWKDDDGDYVVFSSDDELRVAITNTTDNTLRIYIREKELPVRVAGANVSGLGPSPGTSGHNATAPVTLASGPNTNRRLIDQTSPQEKHHRSHHNHTGQNKRSGRNGSSPREQRDPTPSGTQRHHRSINKTDDHQLAMDVRDHVNLDDDVLAVALDQQPSSPNLSNHIGEKHDHPKEAATSTAGVTVTAAKSTPGGSPGAVFCSECRGEGRGVWYRCTVCADFYLCSECENRGLHDQHIMVRIASAMVGRHNITNYHHR